MHFDIVTIFPEIFDAMHYGILGRALKNKLITHDLWNPRDYTQDKHKCVDDRPYGGGPGMVMMAQPLHDTICAIKKNKTTKIIHLSPQGKRLDQQSANRMANEQQLTIVASRYEGVDERFIELDVDEEWSIGDYVLSGGEFAALVMIDAITRLLPGALGDNESANQDSFMSGLLDYQHYTRPENFMGKAVPKVLLSGNHKEINQWRLEQAKTRTKQRRPDLAK